jgi:hypothetical protein
MLLNDLAAPNQIVATVGGVLGSSWVSRLPWMVTMASTRGGNSSLRTAFFPEALLKLLMNT